MYIVKLGIRTFYKLLAFLLASFCAGSRFAFYFLYGWYLMQ